ncbi:MAG TPA: UV DNA damage repair endonuclease UvsE [Clostridiales bacterium]|nr:UV DNA damage repair endonuclease UvsE [Clostridiales bacterium]
MKLRYLGYACINMSLGKTTNKTFRLSNLNREKYLETVSYNLKSLGDIINWNADNGIYFFRIGSELIPFASHENFSFDWKKDFEKEFKKLRKLKDKYKMRFSMHPGQYSVLNSPDKKVVENAVRDIEYHAEVLGLISPDDGKIVIHVGGVYGDKKAAKDRFVKNFSKLSKKARSMLILENDDKSYDIADVLEICGELKIPAVFDILHHDCNPAEGDLSGLLKRVVETWRDDVPKFHISSRKGEKGCPHTDFIEPEDFTRFKKLTDSLPFDKEYDIMIEAKMKDKAILKIMEENYV